MSLRPDTHSPAPRVSWSSRAGLALLLTLVLAPSASAYDVVQHGGSITSVTSLAFSGPSALLATQAGRTTVEASRIDFYETFRRNLGQAGGNLVVFKTGALLRFDNLEIKDGSVAVRVAGGSAFIVPESLIDFEASVREGAMLRLPASAVSSVAVSRGGAGGRSAAVPDEPVPVDDPSGVAGAEPEEAAAQAPTGRPNRPGRPGFTRPRRFGSERAGGEAAQQQAAQNEVDETASPNGDDEPGESVPYPGGTSGTGEQPPPAEEGTGQTVLLVSTTYSGEIGGLQVTVTYPPNLKVVQPIRFSGFASALAMPTVNTRIPGQVQLIAVNTDISGPGVQAGGEFLRLTFGWTGRAPTAQQFSVAVKATEPTGPELPEFPREISVF